MLREQLSPEGPYEPPADRSVGGTASLGEQRARDFLVRWALQVIRTKVSGSRE
jgi:hypothetical protein